MLALGITFEVFHVLGKAEVVRIVLKMCVMEPRIKGKISFINLREIPSRLMAVDLTLRIGFFTSDSSTFWKLKVSREVFGP
jgi:hypothetical protein